MTPTTPSVGGPGPGGPADGGVSTAEILRLLYQADADSSDPFAGFDLARLAAEQRRQLRDELLRRGENLSDADKAAIERGEPDEIKRILRRVRDRRLHNQQKLAQRERDAPAPARPRSLVEDPRSDRLPAPSSPNDLADLVQRVADGRAGADDLAGVDLRSLSPEQLSMLFLLLRNAGILAGDTHRGLFEGGDADGIMELLLRLVGHQKQPRQRSGAGAGGRWGIERLRVGVPLEDAERLRDLKRLLLKLVADLGFPARGASGELHRVPLLQFGPEALRASLRGLGVEALADLLVRLLSPAARVVMARALGVPVPVLLLAAHRAELLDLPIEQGRARPPHLKDIVLLARLGVTTVAHFGRLGAVLDERPPLLDALARLITMLQKRDRSLIARAPIGRHELHDWPVACRRRGSHVRVCGELVGEQSEAERAGENVLAWVLERRGEQAAVDEVFLRLLLMLRDRGVRWQELGLAALLHEVGQEKLELWQRLFEIFEREERQRRREELALFDDYNVDTSDLSLFSDLHPWNRPDLDRDDNMICFWVDPIPDAQHLVSHGVRGAGDSGAVPASLQAVYVCLDTQSGAVVPFGAA